MIARNIDSDKLRGIATLCGFEINISRKSANVLNFTLRLGDDRKFQSYKPHPVEILWTTPPEGIGWKWRRAGRSVCYHGHFEFLRTLFQYYPKAVVESGFYGKVKYTAQDFEEKAEEYGDTRMGAPGNIYRNFMLRDCCHCEHDLV